MGSIFRSLQGDRRGSGKRRNVRRAARVARPAAARRAWPALRLRLPARLPSLRWPSAAPRPRLLAVAAVVAVVVAVVPLLARSAGGLFARQPHPVPTVVRSAMQPLRIAALPCTSALLMEADTGAVLYAQNADAPRGPASLVKMMLLLVAYEALDRGELALDTKVRVSRNASTMGGSQVFLAEGETRTVADLLDAIAIASANDASMALAEHLAGGEKACVARMNERAKELGCRTTHFDNVHGLDLKGQRNVTSARDLARIARALVKHPRALQVSSTRRKKFRGEDFWLDNTNHLLGRFEGLDGLKTGWTPRAGGCFVATAERNGVRFIGVILAAVPGPSRFKVAARLLEAGYAAKPEWHESFHAGDVLADLGRMPAKAGGDATRSPVAGGTVRVLIEHDRISRLSARLRSGQGPAPGEDAGAEPALAWVDVRVDGRTVATVPARPSRRG